MIVINTGSPAEVRAHPPAGVRGSASLSFARRAGRTVMRHSRVEAPLAVIRPFDLPGGRLAVQLVTLGPGLCGGDSIALDISVEDGAEIVLTTTAATRVMTMEPGQHAEQRIRFRAGPGASLEYYPALTIPFPGSALSQSVTIDADPTARIGVIETWALGRAARGEYLRFRSLISHTSLSVAGTLVYADALWLEPGRDDVANAGVLDGRRYLAAGCFHGVTSIAPTESAAGCDSADVALAQSRPGVAYLRALADDAPALDAAVRGSLERVGKAWGRAPAQLDRFRS
jgi:urease accessory protein